MKSERWVGKGVMPSNQVLFHMDGVNMTVGGREC